jgi:four helix bundle protein
MGPNSNDEMNESFRDLLVWQKSIRLSLAIYRFTTGFPKEELFGLTGQIRRAGVSVASNIAEGYGRNSTGEYKQFLGMARGSNSEVETQLVIAKELGYGNQQTLKEAEDLCIEVGKMLRAILRKL